VANVDFVNVCKFTAASAGTGSFVVSAAVTGYQTPLTAGASNFNYRYRAESTDLTQWEVGTGAYTSSNVTLTRTPSINSAGGSSAINFTLAPQVGLTLSADDIQATGQILGTNTNDAAVTGNIGEYVESNIPSSAAITLTSGVVNEVTTLSLSAGDWDVQASLLFSPDATTNVTLSAYSVSASTAQDFVTGGVYNILRYPTGNVPAAGYTIGGVGPVRKSVASSTTFHLIVQATFTVSTMTVNGIVSARRAR